MKIGAVIRTYRKQKNMTQEEMANRLGVTAPAVNKWENGNTMPDITLLAPIARLLEVSLEELLSFREELTREEIRALVQEADRRGAEQSYEALFSWVQEQIRQYPNCEELIYSLALNLDGQRMMRNIPESEKYDEFILGCYERVLNSHEEGIRTAAADVLYGYYLRKEQYEKAQEYLACLSKQNPEWKRKQAVIYEKTGDTEKARRTYEELLLADYQILDSVFNGLFIIELQARNMEKARYYAEKRKMLAELFEMGAYHSYAAELELVQAEQDREKTLACVQGMLDHTDSICAFSKAPLYSHMEFKSVDPAYPKMIREQLRTELLNDESFAYMRQEPAWNKLAERE